MMYPVRTTLLLTVDEKTAQKFLREEDGVEAEHHDESRRSGRLASFLRTVWHGIGDLVFVSWWRMSQTKAQGKIPVNGVTPSK